ncbi:long-chain fatty acid--CoA ligase [Nocardia puris]|uniref:Acyl-CoA synthetase n=1 Tax=Nocardia puris TaxID=208602 RepID=A0A366DVJ0_9NOCA|nr:long-chain fatty acid--CoA ligase [Nocardia puris]MBF6210145.1 long-chain fatty acid--CoA ligase [Nocardia puris]MBF6368336.1 long-chain fatty acid--CoA ligase [Nocardia puris]MBF6457946.1 long-chain fatty acid--CoA ligase [Nocardia puris]RBO94106.1 long-subunit acyl-CoA synthetase (AMP-forming) [Nocardia puris]
MSTTDIGFAHESGKTVYTVPEAFQETITLRPDQVALRTVGGTTEITWREYGQRVEVIAAGLAALGLKRGDTVGIMLTNRPEFNLVDTAALHLGATPFSVYNTSSPEQIRHLFTNAENKVVVTESLFLPIITGAGVELEHVIVVDGPATGALTLAEVEANPAADFDFTAAWRAVESGDLATLIYTSGTTGPSKGVEITHRNVLAQIIALVNGPLRVGFDDRAVSYLPAAHVADRISAHAMSLLTGIQITTVTDPREVAAALPDARPTTFFGVPRVWQKIKAGIDAKLATEPSPVKKSLAQWAIGTGVAAARADLAGKGRGAVLGVQYKLADTLVLSKLRHALGLDELKVAASGAAAIPPETLEYFLGLGFTITEVWGMSETTGVGTYTELDKPRPGSVGRVVDGAEIRLAEDGELLIRGAIVTPGYRSQPDKTKEAIDDDGWLHTGDVATIDPDGYVRIVDRKKELIINESGKNISPSNIENAVKAASSLVGQVVAIGDAKPYIAALIVLDPDIAAVRAKEIDAPADDLAALSTRKEILDEVTAAVQAGNRKLSRVEQIKRFTVLGTLWEPGGDELTPKMSLKRKPIDAKYAAEIASLYTDPIPDTVINVK